MLPEAIELQIVTPQRHVLQQTVQAIEMPGKEGYLGVLPGHAPLITELGIGILAYRTALRLAISRSPGATPKSCRTA